MIERENRGGVALVRLAHGQVNALDLELVTEIVATLDELSTSEHAAIVFTGSGRAFSAGVDLWRVVEGGADYVRDYVSALCQAFETVFNTGKPVVAALNGHAIAGGCILASACDHRAMVDGPARIGVPELLVGVPFPVSAMEILEFAVGPVQARRAALSGRTYPAAEALALGFVDELAAPDAVVDRAIEVAVELATSIPADTFRLTKSQLRLAANERIAARRPMLDPPMTRLWMARATDGGIREY